MERHLPASVADVHHRQALDPLGTLHVLAFRRGERRPRLGARTPVQFDFPFVSWVKRYRVKPEAVVSTVPIFGIVVVDTLIALGFVPEAPATFTIPTVTPVKTTAAANPSARSRVRRNLLDCPANCDLSVKPIRAMPSSFRPVVRPRASPAQAAEATLHHRIRHQSRTSRPVIRLTVASGLPRNVDGSGRGRATGRADGHRAARESPWGGSEEGTETMAEHASGPFEVQRGQPPGPWSAGTWSAQVDFYTGTCSACR